jgi:hypothetical protein
MPSVAEAPGSFRPPRKSRAFFNRIETPTPEHGDSNEKAQNHGAHLAGRRDPGLVYPVLLGAGKRFFAEGTPPRSFELVSAKAMPSGVILSTYKVAGPLKTG